MLKSNQPVVPLNMYNNTSQISDTIAQNTETLDNIKIKERMRAMQKASSEGNSEALSKAARNKRLSQHAAMNTTRLLRKKTAREYADG